MSKHAGYALQFMEEFPTTKRWRGDWYCWVESLYFKLDQEQFLARLWRMSPEMTTYAAKNTMEMLKCSPNVLLPDTLEPPFYIDSFRPVERVMLWKGSLDLETFAYAEPDENIFNLTASPIKYVPGTPAPLEWLAFLSQIMNEREIETLQEWFGYCLTSGLEMQKILLLVGPPRGGKGVICRILRELVGGDYVCAPTLTNLGEPFGLAPLLGKRLAIISDARLNGRSDQQVLLERLLNISGQDLQTVQRKFRTSLQARLGTKAMLVSNELPMISDASRALVNRFLLLELRESFLGREDTGLYARLFDELGGILNWALEGLDCLRARGHFEEPESSAEGRAMLTTLGAPIAEWAEECLVWEGEWVCQEAYAHYRGWAERNGFSPVSAARFGRDLRALRGGRVSRGRRRLQGAQTWVYGGMSLRCDPT